MFQTTNQIRIVLSKLRCDTPRIWFSHQNCWCNKPKMIWPIVQPPENIGIFPTDWILPTKTDIGNITLIHEIPWEWQNWVASTWHSHVNHGRLCWSKTRPNGSKASCVLNEGLQFSRPSCIAPNFLQSVVSLFGKTHGFPLVLVPKIPCWTRWTPWNLANSLKQLG